MTVIFRNIALKFYSALNWVSAIIRGFAKKRDWKKKRKTDEDEDENEDEEEEETELDGAKKNSEISVFFTGYT